MAIKGGQILHTANGFVIDRIQSGGVTGINVNVDKIKELGNYSTVGTIRDTPDLTFEIESYAMNNELEAILTGDDPTTLAPGDEFDFTNAVPIDILSPYKGQAGVFTIDGGVIVPYLTLESMSYSFALGDPASVTATMRGDSIFYVDGSPYRQLEDGDGTTGPITLSETATKTTIAGDDYYALSVMVKYDGSTWTRARLGIDYSNTATTVTFIDGPNGLPPVGTDNIAIVFGSDTQATYSGSVHVGSSIPAGVRGYDIFVAFDAASKTASGTNWYGVQSANVDWRVTLERDEEFGNPNVVAQDYDIPEVDGSITMKPSTVNALYTQILEVYSTSAADIANITAAPPSIGLKIKVTDPADGSTLKSLYIEDAEFTLPALQGRVDSKLEADFEFTSAGGNLLVAEGDFA